MCPQRVQVLVLLAFSEQPLEMTLHWHSQACSSEQARECRCYVVMVLPLAAVVPVYPAFLTSSPAVHVSYLRTFEQQGFRIRRVLFSYIVLLPGRGGTGMRRVVTPCPPPTRPVERRCPLPRLNRGCCGKTSYLPFRGDSVRSHCCADGTTALAATSCTSSTRISG